MEKTRVLFLCATNSARSQMAERFLREYGADRFEAFSAGFDPHEIHPLTIKVMQERGLDMTGYSAKGFSDYMGRLHFGYLVNMCQRAEAQCPTAFPGMGVRLDWSFDDPAKAGLSDEEQLARFREIRDAIDKRVREWLADPSIV